MRISISVRIRILLIGFLFWAQGAVAETIRLGGVGSLTPLVEILAAQYVKKHPDTQVVVVRPPLGSSGGERALTAGKLDIALMGRPIKAGESGQQVAWVRTPIVLASFEAHNKGLTLAQIADIYSGRQTNWAEGQPIRLLLRGAHESETQALRTISPQIDAAVALALKRADLPVAENDVDAVESLTKMAGSFGTSSLGLLSTQGSRLHLLSIDGKTPSAEALQSGAYPWARSYFLLHRETPGPAVAQLIHYLQSVEALAIAQKFHYIAALR